MAKIIKQSTNWKKEELRPADIESFVKDAKDTDVVILVMGATGAGKSTFINMLVGKDVAEVGHDLHSETAQVQHYIIPHPIYPERRLIFVDTPGFDDTVQDDREVLRRVSIWLAQSYDAKIALAGLLYLYEITQRRVLGSARKNLDVFKKLCGPNAARNVILVTTKWSNIRPEIGQKQEEQLKEEYWMSMLQEGSSVCRFMGTKESAWDIVKQILARPALDAVLIQEELVVIDKFLEKTAAGRELRFTLRVLLEVQKKTEEELRENKDDPDLQARLLDNQREIETTVRQIKSLNIPFSKKFRRWWRSFIATPQFVAPVVQSQPKSKSKYDALQATDLVIPIMGTAGAGKSTLINRLIGRDAAVVGHDVASSTSEIQHYVVPYPKYPDRRVIVIDTPGFTLDDRSQEDSLNLTRLVDWLRIQSGGDVSRNLVGVVYLCEIIQQRLTPAVQAVKNLDLFYTRCATKTGRNIVLATTKWDLIQPWEVGERREQQLIDYHWKNIDGTKVWRLDDKPPIQLIDWILGEAV